MRISLPQLTVVALVAFIAPAVGAQANPPATAAQASTADVEREMDSVRQVARTNRKKIIAGGMDLTTEENQKFWPLYAEYRDSSTKQNDRLANIIMEYARNYDTLSDSQARKLMNDYATLDQDRINLRGAYVKKFGAFLPPKKLMRYFQMEQKLDAIMNYEIAGTIPLPKS